MNYSSPAETHSQTPEPVSGGGNKPWAGRNPEQNSCGGTPPADGRWVKGEERGERGDEQSHRAGFQKWVGGQRRAKLHKKKELMTWSYDLQNEERRAERKTRWRELIKWGEQPAACVSCLKQHEERLDDPVGTVSSSWSRGCRYGKTHWEHSQIPCFSQAPLPRTQMHAGTAQVRTGNPFRASQLRERTEKNIVKWVSALQILHLVAYLMECLQLCMMLGCILLLCSSFYQLSVVRIGQTLKKQFVARSKAALLKGSSTNFKWNTW